MGVQAPRKVQVCWEEYLTWEKRRDRQLPCCVGDVPNKGPQQIPVVPVVKRAKPSLRPELHPPPPVNGKWEQRPFLYTQERSQPQSCNFALTVTNGKWQTFNLEASWTYGSRTPLGEWRRQLLQVHCPTASLPCNYYRWLLKITGDRLQLRRSWCLQASCQSENPWMMHTPVWMSRPTPSDFRLGTHLSFKFEALSRASRFPPGFWKQLQSEGEEVRFSSLPGPSVYNWAAVHSPSGQAGSGTQTAGCCRKVLQRLIIKKRNTILSIPSTLPPTIALSLWRVQPLQNEIWRYDLLSNLNVDLKKNWIKACFCRNGVVLAFRSVNDKNKIKVKYLNREKKSHWDLYTSI